MDYDSSTKFISSLAKFLQSLCNGYVEFDNGVEVIGHIYLSVDTGKKIDYILNEKVCKTDENSVTFISNSFHAQPAEKPKPTSKKSKHDIDPKNQEEVVDLDAESNNQQEPRSTNYGTVPRNTNRNQPSPSHRQGKRPSSPLKSGRHSPNSKRSRSESHDQSHISDNGLSAQSPAADPNQTSNAQGAEGLSLETDYGDSYQQSFSQGEDDNTNEDHEERDIKPNIDTDVTFVKEEFAPSHDEGSEDRNQADDASLYSQMYNQPYSGGQGYSNQSYGMPGSSRLSFGASDRSEMFDPGQSSSQMEGDGTDPSEIDLASPTCVPFQQSVGSLCRSIRPFSEGSLKAPTKWSQRPRKFRCTYCPKAFVVSRDLIGHLNAMHIKEQSYSCAFCGRNFNHSSRWRKHMSICSSILN